VISLNRFVTFRAQRRADVLVAEAGGCSRFWKTVAGVRVAAGVAPGGFDFSMPQSADPAGAAAYRYSENRQFIFALSALFCGHRLFEPL
jgi:hypothetical protein